MNKKRKAAGHFTDLYRQSACLANQLAEVIFTSADSLKGREQLSHLSGGDYVSIVSATINPMDYSCADTFSRDYLCVELMSKFPHWELGIDRQHVAVRKWLEVEDRLKTLDVVRNPATVLNQKLGTMFAIESVASRKIADILGDFNWSEAHAFFAFGPGASTGMTRREGDALFKFGAERPQMSYNAEILASALLKAHPSWRFTADVVAGSRLVTVPKNAKTDRVICIEPDLNMYFQKGIGKMIRRRLNRWGLLKPDAQQYNAELARQGSANGLLATVDLSSASDSIHMDVVSRLLPRDWVAAIEQTRSPCTVLPSGEVKLLRKVSSMGNGYTFELETLIFYAICLAVLDVFGGRTTDRQCTVFGDDIIISTEMVPALEWVLNFYGFEMNLKKTFREGKFRESCGKHYFAGIDVTPFYIRDRIDSVPRKYWAANTVRRYSRLQWGLDPRWQEAYNLCVTSIPRFFRGFRIPDGFGDGGLIADWDEVRPTRSSRGHDAWVYTSLIPKFEMKRYETHGVLLKSLHRLELPMSPEGRANFHERTTELIQLLSGESELSRAFPDVRDQALASVVKTNGGSGLSQSDSIPHPRGYKVHTGTAQRWPSYGPWLVSPES